MNELLEELNESQRAAVVNTEGPTLIVAGAGSGKTRVLTYRIAYLLTQGVPASSILALTFTNKAAREMKERIMKLVPASDARYLWMGTFHHVCTQLLRKYAERLGFTKDFSIYDTTDSKSVIKAICKEHHFDDKIYKPATVISRISLAKNNFISPAQYGANKELLTQDREMRLYDIPIIYEQYQLRLRAANAMDFDDLLIYMLHLLEYHHDICEQLQQMFRYILVDEYQDTNLVQYRLVHHLAEPQHNICVVGDDAQSIYSFRGADIRNILNFQKHYPEAKIFKLERNYRSTRNIVSAANSLIHKNVHQIEKNVYSEKEDGSPLSLYAYMDDRAEANGVAEMIAKVNKKSYENIAILYRTNSQSRSFEGELRKRNIPYRIYGGTSFYQRKEIKDALGYFRLAVNPRDNESLLRIVGFPGRGIGETTMHKVAANAIEHRKAYLDVMRQPDETGLEVSAATRKKITAFAALIDQLREQSETMDAFAFAEYVLNVTGVQTALLLDRTPEGVDRAQNVQELLNAIREFVDQRVQEGIDYTPITDFLSEVSLQTDQDENLDDTTERVTLMTVHAAKGLEFPIVFIVGMEEDLFPSKFCTTPGELEEERRLLYVAITRSMERCVLTYARQRFRNGQVTFNSPSRFLNDIDRQFMEIARAREPQLGQPRWANNSWVSNSWTSTEKKEIPVSPFSTTSRVSGATSSIASDTWKNGDRVVHRVFGLGTVIRVYRDEVTENDKIEINFDTSGTKTLLLTHAKLDRT